jgi:hypothetical protein
MNKLDISSEIIDNELIVSIKIDKLIKVYKEDEESLEIIRDRYIGILYSEFDIMFDDKECHFEDKYVVCKYHYVIKR